jgi:hypothetical protein
MNTISNVDLQKITKQIAVTVHEQAVQIRKDYEILDGNIKLYSDYAIYGSEDDKFYAFHYVVHVDNQTERFFIVVWIPATMDEYLDSIDCKQC